MTTSSTEDAANYEPDHFAFKPHQDLGTLLLCLIQVALTNPTTYPTLQFGTSGQVKAANFFRTSNGQAQPSRLNVETTAGMFLITVDQYTD